MNVPGVTLWRRIADALQNEIAAGTLPPGTQLPTEAQLALRFDVNRHTVRRAIEQLSRSGMVRVEQGRGSFVTEDVLDYEVSPRTRFSEWIRSQNREPSGRVLDLAETPADPQVAANLAVASGEAVIRLERLGLADGSPVVLGTHWFVRARFPNLAAILKSGRGITEALAECGLPDYRRQTTKVSARLPTAKEASLLRMQPNRPLLLCENVNIDAAGAVVEFCIGRYPTPRVQIVFEP